MSRWRERAPLRCLAAYQYCTSLFRGDGISCRFDKLLNVIEPLRRRGAENDSDDRARNADVEHDREIPARKVREACFPQYKAGYFPFEKVGVVHIDPSAILRRQGYHAPRRRTQRF